MMSAQEQTHGERIAKLEATVAAQEIRLNGMEQRTETRLATIEAKLDRLWWKFGLVVGAIAGAANLLPDLIGNL
jgi:uncharacterized coiled-coil protein SlyX